MILERKVDDKLDDFARLWMYNKNMIFFFSFTTVRIFSKLMQWNTLNAEWIKWGVVKHLAYLYLCGKTGRNPIQIIMILLIHVQRIFGYGTE